MSLHIPPALMAKYHQAREAKVFAEKALSLAEEVFSDTEAELLGELRTVIELTPDEIRRNLKIGIGQSFYETDCHYLLVSCQWDFLWERFIGRLYFDGRIVMDGDEPDEHFSALLPTPPDQTRPGLRVIQGGR